MSYFKKLVIVFLLLPIYGYAALPSIAFFYGHNPPLNQLKTYNVIVVQPDADVDPKKYNTKESQLFAYISAGEVALSATYIDQIPKQWLISDNSIWRSKVIDQTPKEWPKFFVDHFVSPLWEKGYRGFFFDTLDSYRIVASRQAEQQKQINGLISVISAVKSRYPSAQIILNRGFELLPFVHNLIYVVSAESLFSSWNEQLKKYEPVKPADHEWLLNKLLAVQKMGLPVNVVDYVDPSDRAQAIKIAKKIYNLNMIPWVTDGHLSTIGVGKVEFIPNPKNQTTNDIVLKYNFVS